MTYTNCYGCRHQSFCNHTQMEFCMAKGSTPAWMVYKTDPETGKCVNFEKISFPEPDEDTPFCSVKTRRTPK